jgi:hypothetical protein
MVLHLRRLYQRGPSTVWVPVIRLPLCDLGVFMDAATGVLYDREAVQPDQRDRVGMEETGALHSPTRKTAGGSLDSVVMLDQSASLAQQNLARVCSP